MASKGKPRRSKKSKKLNKPKKTKPKKTKPKKTKNIRKKRKNSASSLPKEEDNKEEDNTANIDDNNDDTDKADNTDKADKTDKTDNTDNTDNESVRSFKGHVITDVEIAKETNKGTLASSNVIDYHYQNLDNIVEYFNILHNKKKLKSGYSTLNKEGKGKGKGKVKAGSSRSGTNLIEGNKDMLKDFKDDINFFKPSVDHSLIQVDIPKETNNPIEKIEGIYTTIDKFLTNFKKFNIKRFTPITINNLLPLPNGQIENHANMVLIDNELKQVELFEPHGYKPETSDSKNSNKAYHDKLEALKAFFINKHLDNSNYSLSSYEFIPAADFVQSDGFQALFDSNSGYCVTWSAIYCHYRILNPDVPVKDLVEYLDESIATGTILQYAKHIEDTLKKKI